MQLVANLYKKEIKDYASAVGDAVIRLLDTQGTEYLTKREANEVRAFVTSNFSDNPPKGLIDGLHTVDVRIGTRSQGIVKRLENELATTKSKAHNTLLAQIDEYVLGKRNTTKLILAISKHPLFVTLISFVSGFLARGCIPVK